MAESRRFRISERCFRFIEWFRVRVGFRVGSWGWGLGFNGSDERCLRFISESDGLRREGEESRRTGWARRWIGGTCRWIGG